MFNFENRIFIEPIIMIKRVLLCVCGIFCVYIASAQENDDLYLSNATYSQTHVSMGDMVHIFMDAKYFLTDTSMSDFFIADSLKFGYRVNGIDASQPLAIVPGNPFMFHEDSLIIELQIPVTPSYFIEGGGHVIIIWPLFDDGPTIIHPDTIEMIDTVYVNGYLLIENFPDLNVFVYPNPTEGNINFSAVGAIEIEEVVLYDMEGRFLLKYNTYAGSEQHMDISFLPAGTYIVEMRGVAGVYRQRLFKR